MPARGSKQFVQTDVLLLSWWDLSAFAANLEATEDSKAHELSEGYENSRW